MRAAGSSRGIRHEHGGGVGWVGGRWRSTSHTSCAPRPALPRPAPRRRLADERALLAAIKELKLAELAEAGVPAKYHAQLARMAV